MEDLRPFGLGDFVSLITGMSFSLWGNIFTFECVYDPIDRKPYKMTFLDCRDINWHIHSPEDAEDDEADVIDIQLVKQNNKKTTIIYTDIFELSMTYGSIRIEKDW